MAQQKTPAWRRHGSRYKARARAVDILFEAETRDEDPVGIVEDRVELAQWPEPPVQPIKEYTRQIVEGVAVELDRLDDVIADHLSDDWELHRIPAVDRAVLRVSAWELLFNPEVPRATAVVEGVELAANYSGPEASAYINAVLDDIAEQAENERAALAVVETKDEDDVAAEGGPGSSLTATVESSDEFGRGEAAEDSQ